MAAQTPQPLSLEAVMTVVTALQNQVQQTNQMLALVQHENATLAQVQQQMLAEIQNPFGVLLHQGRLRRPQSEALNAIMDRFGNGGAGDTVLLVVDTGCGKSGIIALAPFYMQNPRPSRVLVIAPNVNIRDQLGETLRGGQRPRFLIERGLISPHQPLQTLPTVAVIDQPIFPVVAAQNHIIVTNIQRLDPVHLAPFPRDQFDVVIVDEAHHYRAPSYIAVINHFQNARRVFLTATPFRVDPDHPLPIREDHWYTYTYTDAVHDGVIKEFEDIVTVDGEDLVGSVLDEVHRQLGLLNNDNPFVQQNPLQAHQAIVFAQNTASANEIGDQCAEYGLTCSVIHLGVGPVRARQLVAEFEHGTNQVAVVVGMMLEGYDNKRLSVAAFTYSITRLKKYIQAVGRVVRRSSSPEDRDNKAHVITHSSLNIALLHTKYMANERVEADEELNEDP